MLVDSSKRKVSAVDGGSSGGTVVDDKKYARRPAAWKRTLQRFLPSLFQPGLPVTTKCVGARGPSSSRALDAGWMGSGQGAGQGRR